MNDRDGRRASGTVGPKGDHPLWEMAFGKLPIRKNDARKFGNALLAKIFWFESLGDPQ